MVNGHGFLSNFVSELVPLDAGQLRPVSVVAPGHVL